MAILNYLPLFAGIGLFLYGMDMLAKAIERLAGAKLEKILENLTNNKWKGLALGTGVTAIIQSSAATTITVVGFVNAGMMRLAQALPVVFGANIGSTATAQILRLGDLQAGGIFLSLLKPSTFAPLLIIIGAAINLVGKKRKTKNIAVLLMGFGILFFGMTTMENTLSPLKDSPTFQNLFTAFNNPILGILAGLGLTALIQSSSAAVGILQTLTVTGSVTFATAFPLLMGINIGKCFTVFLASFGTNKNSKRTVAVHLIFNVFGAVVFTALLYGLNVFLHFPFLHTVMTRGSVADLHTGFNLLTALLLMPAVNILVNIATRLIPDSSEEHENHALDCLDERFLKNPKVAMEQCRKVLSAMCDSLQENLDISISLLAKYDEKKASRLDENERFLDKCEAAIGEYLVKTTHHTMTEDDSQLATEILQMVSDFERIGDYCVRLADTALYTSDNDLKFTSTAQQDVDDIFAALQDIVNLAIKSYRAEGPEDIMSVKPLEMVIDSMVDDMQNAHIHRLQSGECGIDSSISFVEICNNAKHIADHCSNISIYIVQRHKIFANFDGHSYVKALQRGDGGGYRDRFNRYREKYLTPMEQRNKK